MSVQKRPATELSSVCAKKLKPTHKINLKIDSNLISISDTLLQSSVSNTIPKHKNDNLIYLTGKTDVTSSENINLEVTDLKVLLQNFYKLESEEQQTLICHMRKLETENPELVEELKKFVRVTSPEVQNDDDTNIFDDLDDLDDILEDTDKIVTSLDESDDDCLLIDDYKDFDESDLLKNLNRKLVIPAKPQKIKINLLATTKTKLEKNDVKVETIPLKLEIKPRIKQDESPTKLKLEKCDEPQIKAEIEKSEEPQTDKFHDKKDDTTTIKENAQIIKKLDDELKRINDLKKEISELLSTKNKNTKETENKSNKTYKENIKNSRNDDKQPENKNMKSVIIRKNIKYDDKYNHKLEESLREKIERKKRWKLYDEVSVELKRTDHLIRHKFLENSDAHSIRHKILQSRHQDTRNTPEKNIKYKSRIIDCHKNDERTNRISPNLQKNSDEEDSLPKYLKNWQLKKEKRELSQNIKQDSEKSVKKCETIIEKKVCKHKVSKTNRESRKCLGSKYSKTSNNIIINTTIRQEIKQEKSITIDKDNIIVKIEKNGQQSSNKSTPENGKKSNKPVKSITIDKDKIIVTIEKNGQQSNKSNLENGKRLNKPDIDVGLEMKARKFGYRSYEEMEEYLSSTGIYCNDNFISFSDNSDDLL